MPDAVFIWSYKTNLRAICNVFHQEGDHNQNSGFKKHDASSDIIELAIKMAPAIRRSAIRTN